MKFNYLIITFLLLFINNSIILGSLIYNNPISFENILSGYPYYKTIIWNETNVVVRNPKEQKRPTQIIGSNVPMNTSTFNNPTLMKFFSGSNSSYATMLSQFNCQNSGDEASCMEFNFSNPQKYFCFLLASLDGFDHVTLKTDNEKVRWNQTESGSFSTDLPACTAVNPHKREYPSEGLTSFGCFEDVCQNPNFYVFKATDVFQSLKVCYNSYHKDSSNILYSFDRCTDELFVVTSPPKISAYSISGYAFLDYDADGSFDPLIDDPIANVVVRIVTSLGKPARDLSGAEFPEVKTNKLGYYNIQGLPRSSYKISFQFSGNSASPTLKSTDYTNTKTSKINANFITDTLVLSHIASGVVDNDDERIRTDKVLKGINAGLVPSSILVVEK